MVLALNFSLGLGLGLGVPSLNLELRLELGFGLSSLFNNLYLIFYNYPLISSFCISSRTTIPFVPISFNRTSLSNTPFILANYLSLLPTFPTPSLPLSPCSLTSPSCNFGQYLSKHINSLHLIVLYTCG